MKVLGLDPGLTGGIALIAGSDLMFAMDMPTIEITSKNSIDARSLVRILAQVGQVDMVVIESVNSFGMGRTSAYNFGEGNGVIRGVLAALERPVTYMRPTAWQKAIGKPTGTGKDWSRNRAAELWPYQADLFSKVKNDGRAEAALIALAWINLDKKGMAA